MSTTHASHQHLRRVLYEAFRASPDPVISTETNNLPGAAMWTGARLWCQRFRESGLRPGDRVVLRCPRSPGHVMVTLAAWWEGLTLCPVSPHDQTAGQALLHAYDARVLVEGSSEPLRNQQTCGAPTPGIALVLRTSGTGGRASCVCLSYTNLLHQLLSHRDALGMTCDDRALCSLPWHHAFGLLVDLWPALLSGAAVVIDRDDGRSAETIVKQIGAGSITHASFVPSQVSSVLEVRRGLQTLQQLRGGVVGGAPISRALVHPLTTTSLRVGYGQTEASPGIALGKPGCFAAGILGSPFACQWKIVHGELHIRGRNVCVGYWEDRALRELPYDRWLATGDRVESSADGLTFVGRNDHRFKLDTGRMVDAPAIERSLIGATAADEAVVLPADGRAVSVSLVTPGAPKTPSPGALRSIESVVAGYSHRVASVRRFGRHDVPRTSKGDIDRSRLAAMLRQKIGPTRQAA
ncbi:MAG: class I adenylate-forming enzyme family protein [Planctomycetota bacterium]